MLTQAVFDENYLGRLVEITTVEMIESICGIVFNDYQIKIRQKVAIVNI